MKKAEECRLRGKEGEKRERKLQGESARIRELGGVRREREGRGMQGESRTLHITTMLYILE
jgi:hypothetical protein